MMDIVWRIAHCAAILALTSSQQQTGWGEWSLPSACTRQCDGGVQYQVRFCLPGSGPGDCEGPSKIYTSCNIQECPEGTQDFRASQCERYNSIPFNEQYYNWVPYYGGSNECELNCLAEGETFYYRHATKVVDGTPCNPDTRDVCVDGVCQPVGCDNMLGSGAQYDQCRVCDGDGATCKTVVGNLTTDGLEIGYSDLLLIPAAATSIKITEETHTNNYLALRDLTGHYLLNGNWVVDLAKPRDVAGTRFDYTRHVTPGEEGAAALETLAAPGPTANAVILSVLRQPGKTSNILYEYAIPVDNTKSTSTDYYTWWTDVWGECSNTCAHGTQERVVMCTRSSDGSLVPESLCDPFKKPETTQSCNEQPCEAFWYTGLWEECSASCGSGLQVRTVFCQQAIRADKFAVVADALCSVDKPVMMQVCDSGSECPMWHMAPWSKCNRVCGPGQQVREVTCQVEGELLAEARCDWELRPEAAQPCDLQPCEGAEWVTSEWSGCHGTCEQGYETRQVVCSSRMGMLFDEAFCDETRKPDTSRPCSDDTHCQGVRWFASQWGPCSANCGPGIASRTVVCAQQLDTHNLRIVNTALCEEADKPELSQACTVQQCTGLWFKGPWGKCSKPCDGGEQEREVMCIADGDGMLLAACDYQSQPPKYQPCNTFKPCDDEELIIDCLDSEFGCCPDKFTPAEGPNFLNCPPKDAIPVGACIESDFGCCLDGVNSAQGPFLAGCPEYDCRNTYWGCCWDYMTPADGPNGEGCPIELPCQMTLYGCCEDGVKAAQGPMEQGCYATGPGTERCENSLYGCCPDSVTTALGPRYEGCEVIIESSGEIDGADCENTFYGCCLGSDTPATGPNYEGCSDIPLDCNATPYGCCPDGVTEAQGSALEGCPGIIPGDQGGCETSRFGCCPDGETPMEDESGTGCEVVITEINDCENSLFGCCPDGKSEATGDGFEGCDDVIVVAGCETSYYGCCPDGLTPAEGYHLEGCDNVTQTIPECDTSSFGCCPDGQSVATGPMFEGCAENATLASCEGSLHGCCRDGLTRASGPNDAGCPWRIEGGAVCALPKDLGPCTDYTVMWFYDASSGQCARYWYGGCEGNENRFASREQCEAKCVSPQGIDKCYLPQAIGRCSDFEQKFYYDAGTQQCESFMYGGCKGNNNKFDTLEACHTDCVKPQTANVCSQPQRTGPCRGHFVRWFHDANSGMCREFIYGGCLGNENRFETADMCEERCERNATELCKLEVDTGPCQADYERWYFNQNTRSCERFTYGGCQGNANRFATRDDCEDACHELLPEKEKDRCEQPRDGGKCKGYFQRWFYNRESQYCEEFVYGGCEGNDNRFGTEQECRQQCNALEKVDPCTLMNNIGTGSETHIRYFFDTHTGQCREFVYSGEGGNENRFDSQEECRKTCREYTPTLQPDYRDKCTLPVAVGPCVRNVARWHFSTASGTCEEFIYGGCEGNRNRFLTRELCERDCGATDSVTTTTTTMTTTTTARPTPVETTQTPHDGGVDVCTLPVESGPCLGYVPSWYFDSASATCQQFVYGGCEGNGNRFDTEEECLNQCQQTQPEVSGIGICVLESDAGPCKADIERWYYEAEKGRCLPFSYGGCGGNANRFTTELACQNACNAQDICALQSETGPCRANKLRYAFNPLLGRCEEFYYGGCRGNANRFLSLETCQRTCSQPTQAPVTTEVCSLNYERGDCDDYAIYWYYNAGAGRCAQFYYGGCGGNGNRFLSRDECEDLCSDPDTTPAPTTSTTTSTTAAVVTSGVVTRQPGQKPEGCAQLECRIACEYGLARGEDGCQICQCADACQDYECPEHHVCVLDEVQCVMEPCYPVPVCEPVPKPGECPVIPEDMALCMYECDNDRDCAGEDKCCDTGCGKMCATPGRGACALSIFGCCPDGETTSTGWNYEGCKESAPVIENHPQELYAALGETVRLLCRASGVPTPAISWYKNRRPVGYSDMRTRQHRDGSLEIKHVTADDASTYSCRAYNPLGGDTRTFMLTVQIAPTLDESTPTSISAREGDSVTLDCGVVGGSPAPSVRWLRDGYLVSVDGERVRETRDEQLVLSAVTSRDAATYTCEVNNGVGAPLRRDITLAVTGIETSAAPSTPAPLKIELSSHKTDYKIGETLEVICEEIPDSYDVTLTWLKDGVKVDYSDNRVISIEYGILEVVELKPSDSGTYSCEAQRGDGETVTLSTDVTVASASSVKPGDGDGTDESSMPENCEDQPLYANCKLIVEANYCHYPYYRDFCCRSCHLAGLLKR